MKRNHPICFDEAQSDAPGASATRCARRPRSVSYPGFHLCYPRQRNMSPATRAFVDALKAGRRLAK